MNPSLVFDVPVLMMSRHDIDVDESTSCLPAINDLSISRTMHLRMDKTPFFAASEHGHKSLAHVHIDPRSARTLRLHPSDWTVQPA